MKWSEVAVFFMLIVISSVGLVLFGWAANHDRKTLEKIPYPQSYQQLEGTHTLRKMNTTNATTSEIMGDFFLVAGTINGYSKLTQVLTFAWQLSSGEYAISTIPLNKVRIQIDEKVTTPYVSFKHQPDWRKTERPIQEEIDLFVEYVIITCRPEDWTINVRMPLQ